MQTEQSKQLSVGIIGAGRVGTRLLEIFHQSQHTCVAFILDTNLLSPGIMRAKELNVQIFQSIDKALSQVKADYIFEVTGSNQVAAQIKAKLQDTETEVITHQMAFILIASLEEQEQKTCALVVNEISGIKSEIARSLSNVKKMVNDLDDVNSDMRLLALNARIEAARIGDLGKGFGVVAQHMTRSVDDIRNISAEIETLSNDILTVSNKIDGALARLQMQN